MTLRTRILLTVAPLLLLTAALGGADAVLLYQISGRIDAILRDNLRSVDYMADLNDALDGIDGSFLQTLLGRGGGLAKYEKAWAKFKEQQANEERNVTVPNEEREGVDELAALAEAYRKAGDRFNAAPTAELYFGPHMDEGLADQHRKIHEVARQIRLLNEREMRKASEKAQRATVAWCLGLAGGLAATALLAGLLAWTTLRAVVGPLRALARTAEAVGAGDLNRTLREGDDEVGQVAHAFNAMTRQLRAYNQSQSARLLRAQRTGQAVVDSFPDPILVVEPGGRVEMANPAARRLLGATAPASGEAPNDGRESSPAGAWQPPPSLRQPLTEALQRKQPFRTQSFDQTIDFRLDGEERAFLPQILPIGDPSGDALGAAVVLSDVTRFRLMDQVKSNLVATLSHELKTPLACVRLNLHLLLEQTVGPLTPKQASLMVDARDNAERLLRIIEDLLALAHVEYEGDSLQFQPEAPEALLWAGADELQPRAAAKQVEVVVNEVEGLPAVGVDRQRFGYALSNLLDNALTYTEEGGRITLSAALVGDAWVRFSVADTGIGIPSEHLPHIFEKFFRVPGQSRGRGTGLGLAIVREIAVAHHGDVACESRPGQGTVFALTLPVWLTAGGDEMTASQLP
jgi:two-component system, NtrC family, sensor histidine kinase KinB